MKKLALTALVLLSISYAFAQSSDDGSWITRRTPWADRLQTSAQEILSSVSRKLSADTTSYRALEVVASPGNFKVQVDSTVPLSISVSPSTAPVTISNTVTVTPVAPITTWHEFQVTGATSGILYPNTYLGRLVSFSVYADGGNISLSTPFGSTMVVTNGMAKVSPRFDSGITSSTMTISGMTLSATYYIDVFGN